MPHAVTTSAARALFLGQRPGQKREVFLHGEKERPIKLHVLKQVDLHRDRARDVGGVPSDFAIALHRMHVPEVDATSFYLTRDNDDGAGARRRNVHVPIGTVHELILGYSLWMRCANEECTEVPGIVRVWQGDRWAASQLAHEYTRPCHKSHQVVWCEGKN